MQRLAHNGCVLLSVEQFDLLNVSHMLRSVPLRSLIPVEALYILATLSMLPVTKNVPSGDQARS